MNWYEIFGIVSAFALLIPIIFIIALKLFTRQSFAALVIYYLISAAYNLITQGVISAPQGFTRSLGIIVNLLDAPLMLLFLSFFSTTPVMKKRIYAILLIFMSFELLVVGISGFNIRTIRIILAPDIAIILCLSAFFFFRNVRLAITNLKSLGKAIMISAILLAYSIFSIIYIYYYLLNTQYVKDTQLVYNLVSLFSSLLMASGILIENKRLKKLDELKHTRKELATIYGHTKTAVIDKNSRFLRAR